MAVRGGDDCHSVHRSCLAGIHGSGAIPPGRGAGQDPAVLLAELERVNNGSLPEIPVIFVGYQSAELTGVCRRTEMYGWSFFKWDYSVERPTGATHRIVGFVQAYTKNRLNEEATEEQKERAAVLAAGMPDFPAEGCVQVTGDFVVVRLSGITERTDNDWW